MEKVPEEITICQLECVLMPQGEIICNGQTLGWWSTLGTFLTIKEPAEKIDSKG